MLSSPPTVVNHCGFDYELHLVDKVPHYILRAPGEKPIRIEVARLGPHLWRYPVYSRQGDLLRWKSEDKDVSVFLEDELALRTGDMILAP